MDRQQHASDLPRERFELVRPLLESARKKTRPRKHDLYDVYCAVLFFLEQGVSWRNLPDDFPPWRTVHEYFTQWTMPQPGGGNLLEAALARSGNTAAAERLRSMLGR